MPRPLDLIALKLHAQRSSERLSAGKDLPDISEMKYEDEQTEKTSALATVRDEKAASLFFDLPEVDPGEGPRDHPEATFSQMLAHAHLLLSWEKQRGDFLERRRALMNPERFVM